MQLLNSFLGKTAKGVVNAHGLRHLFQWPHHLREYHLQKRPKSAAFAWTQDRVLSKSRLGISMLRLCAAKHLFTAVAAEMRIDLILKSNVKDSAVDSRDKVGLNFTHYYFYNIFFKDVCTLPYDSGPCQGSFRKWYYEPRLRECREFQYGGCEGNSNRFSSAAECETLCLHREEVIPRTNETSISHHGMSGFGILHGCFWFFLQPDFTFA